MTSVATTPRLVIVAETHENLPKASESLDDYKLRNMSGKYVDKVIAIFQSAGFEVVHYEDPGKFAKHAPTNHTADVVFSLWHGTGTRNQVALIPAICEAYCIRYIGADTLARVICEDKALGRAFAHDNGLKVPQGVALRSIDDFDISAIPEGKLVIKPTFGGMSQGVRIYDPETDGPLTPIVKQALGDGSSPILVESFIPGREVMVVMMGEIPEVDFFEAVEVTNKVEPTFFESTIFDADLKQTMSSSDWEMQRVTDELPPGVQASLKRAFAALGEVHYLRIDGRWDGDTFWFIELSPTPHFNKMAPLPVTSAWRGMELEDIVRRLVELSGTCQTGKNANKTYASKST